MMKVQFPIEKETFHFSQCGLALTVIGRCPGSWMRRTRLLLLLLLLLFHFTSFDKEPYKNKL